MGIDMRFALAALTLALAPSTALAENVSNFSMVGFPTETADEESFLASVLEYTQTCEVIELDEDDVSCLVQGETGGQMWIGLRQSPEGYEFITANPAFVGKSSFPATVQARVSDPDWEPHEYQLSVSFSDLEIPLLIEIADPREAARFEDIASAREMTFDLTAFTFRPEVFADEEAFTKAQVESGSETVLAPNFFIPTGLFEEEPIARAAFAGKVLEARKLAGENGEHWWALVEVMEGAKINVVFDPSTVERDPQPGNLIVGDYWLSAQVPAK